MDNNNGKVKESRTALRGMESVVDQARKSLERLINQIESQQSGLAPRREEILEVVMDHPRCTFDFIKRRFMAVNPKTLHYDIGWLLKNGLIRKLGVTRGVVYEAVWGTVV